MKIEDAIQQKTFKSPYQKAVINLIYTSNWLQSKHQSFFKSFGITGQQYNILRVLKGQHPKSISATEIKTRLLDQNSDVSRLLNRLEAKKLIIKQTCPNDRRATDVFITTDGLRLLTSIDQKEKQLDQVIALSPDEAEKLSELLDRARGSGGEE